MFERLTREAGVALRAAATHAHAYGADGIGTEHLLLGLSAGNSVAGRVLHELGAHELAIGETLRTGRHEARLLRMLGIDLDEVRTRVERAFGAGAWLRARRRRRARFTPETRQALEQAIRHARRLGCKHIEAAHLLLGVLDVGGAAAEVLAALDVDPLEIRRRLTAERRAA